MKDDLRLIFVTGGVLSSLGKGVIASSLGAMLKSQGLNVTLVKVDPYLNIDAGTMSPFQHGEVFVTDDGAETDLDMGYYERFLNCNLTANNHITSGKVLQTVISRERKGDYLGSTVQVIPHVTDEIKAQMTFYSKQFDVVIIEIGGTVGDIESQPFLESVRQLKYEYPYALCVHVTLVPYIKTSDEVKTKPTQHSVKELRSVGITPDFIVTRSDSSLPSEHKQKIALFSNLDSQNIFESPNVETIYQVPLLLDSQGMGAKVMEKLGLNYQKETLFSWERIVETIKKPQGKVKVAVVGKYSSLADAYKSINEALLHAGVATGLQVEIDFLASESLEQSDNIENSLKAYHGILIPGGFGERGLQGKLLAARYCREHNVPYFGICLGMQVAVLEFCHNVLGQPDAQSAEFCDDLENPVFHLVKQWVDDQGQVHWRGVKDHKGGTMRVGQQRCLLKKGTRIHSIYGCDEIAERHRHRYELNNAYTDLLEEAGLTLSGLSQDNGLCETIEISKHHWFIGCQYHPEFVSKPLTPHPLFISFVEALFEKKTCSR